jgi:uncharacterized protein YceK
MKRLIPVVISISLLSGCASIVSYTSWPVEINSAPEGAAFSVQHQGQEIYTGVTPAIVKLDSGEGYFNAADYTVSFKKEGFFNKTTTLSADVNKMYFGNLIFGDLIGMLIVDPATGAMFTLPETFTTPLISEVTGRTSPAEELWNYRIYK